MAGKTLDNEAKERRFRFPSRDFVGFGRKLSCVSHGGALWVAAQMETTDKNTLVIVRHQGGESRSIELPRGPDYHRPALVAGSDGELGLVWNEFEEGAWRVKFAQVRDEPLALGRIETAFTSARLCMPPAAAWLDGDVHVAWPAATGDRIRIMVAQRQGGSWRVKGPISDTSVDAFRPSMCAARGTLSVLWDQYRDRRYEIAGMRISESACEEIEAVGVPGERWFCPDVAATREGEVYVTWVALREVADDLGIADHAAWAMVGRVTECGVEMLEDQSASGDSRVIADLREGLLPSVTSKGYVGLRRNPMLSVDSRDRLWCLWETRVEAEATAVAGHLTGRRFDGGSWSDASLLGNPGYGYAVPKQQAGDALLFAHFRFTETGLDIIATGTADHEDGRVHAPGVARWARWHEFDIAPLVKSKRIVEVDGVAHTMFWADTHCHSNFSPDAEGEPDEIIHYARDIAGLDALCVIDNDFYPHKTLSPAEWRVHQENSRHFTKKGEFVLFPGYEFTYHRRDLSPDFNHRCVIYPGPDGELHRRIDPESDTDDRLLSTLKQTDAMCYPHHCGYKLIDPSKEWNVEVCSSWRAVLAECDFSIQQLRQGHKFGFIGSSDAHRANPGLGGALTGVYATELTPEALFDAYRNRRIIATQGFAVFIDFRVGGLFIGSEGVVSGPPLVEAVVEAPKEIETVCVLRDGIEVHRISPGSRACDLSFTDEAVATGSHFYFLKLKLVGDPAFNTDPAENSRAPFTLNSRYPHNMARARGVFAWTSPVWVDVT